MQAFPAEEGTARSGDLQCLCPSVRRWIGLAHAHTGPHILRPCEFVEWYARTPMELSNEAWRAMVQGRGKFLGGGNFTRIYPPAKFSWRVTNNFTVNSDAGQYCEFRHVQRCTGQREGTKMCLFATCSGCVTGMH